MKGEIVNFKGLLCNAPKEAGVELPHFPFKKPITSFPDAETIRSYILDYAVENNVRKFIKTWTRVDFVRFHEENRTFSIRTKNLEDETETSEIFDYVVVANGHFTKPKIPILSGEENFNGQIIHSHDFKTAEIYTGIGSNTKSSDF